jgi:hypothetical protein
VELTSVTSQPARPRAGLLAGFPPGTALTASHIHPGDPGVSGGVFVSLGPTPDEVTFATGSGSFSKRGITLT